MGLSIFRKMFSSREDKGMARARLVSDIALREATIKMEAERRHQLSKAYAIAGFPNNTQHDLTINK